MVERADALQFYELHAYLIRRFLIPGIKIVFVRFKHVWAFLLLLLIPPRR